MKKIILPSYCFLHVTPGGPLMIVKFAIFMTVLLYFNVRAFGWGLSLSRSSRHDRYVGRKIENKINADFGVREK